MSGSRLAIAACVLLAPLAAGAQQADFYRDRTITISVGFGPGGGYDLHARTLARFLGRYIPGNPAVVVKNAPGGAGLTLVNALYNVGAKDGTELATFDRSIPLEPLIGSSHNQFDPLKMNWIGSTSSEISTCVAWHDAAVKTYADLLEMELVTSGTGPAADVVVYPKIMNALAGTKFRIVSGYKDSAEALLAMQRGETKGFCAWGWSTMEAIRPEWLRENKVNVLLQFGFQKHPAHQDVPLALDMVKTKEARDALELVIGPQLFARPFVAPPGVPKERITILREAFVKTMKDPDYLAEAQRLKMDVALVTGEEVEGLLKKLYTTPAATVDRVKAAIR